MPYSFYLPYNVVAMKPRENEFMMKRIPNTTHVNSNSNFETPKRMERKKGRKVLNSEERRKPVRFLQKLFCLSLTINLIFLISLAYLLVTLLSEDKSTEFCDTIPLEKVTNEFSRNSNPFCDLSLEEIHSVIKFMYHKSGIGVTVDIHNLTLVDTFIYSIELNTPSKSNVIGFLDQLASRPQREAKVIIFNGNTSSVDEYIIAPVDEDWRQMSIVRKRVKKISYRMRQHTHLEILGIHMVLKSYVDLHFILKESYGATLHSCVDEENKNRCLIAFTSYVPVLNKNDKRMVWIQFYYDKEFYTLYPLDLQLLIDVTPPNCSEWTIVSVWYGNRIYHSYKNFLKLYKNGSIEKVKMVYPKVSVPPYGSLNPRSDHLQTETKRAPRQVEPDGHRYEISSQTVTYLKWRFQWKNSLVRGPTLYNIEFNSERIVYELGLQDIVTVYTGANPAFSHASFSDAFSGLGSKSAGLVPGIDCPGHASFINVTILIDEFNVGGILPNAICIFEHNLDRPLRRHSSTTLRHGGVFYGGLLASVLVFRTIFVISSSDYIMDYIFYESGTIETKIYPTGYMLTSFPFPGEQNYGTKVGNLTYAPAHLHLFNFKVDIDIMGTRNRYETLDVSIEPSFSPGKSFSKVYEGQTYKYVLKSNLKRTEKQAAYKYDFSVPKYHVIYNDKHLNKYQEHKGYRVEASGFVNTLFPQNVGFVKSIPWSRYQMAVTKKKDNEESSSSYAAFHRDPAINFENFIKDDENIVDEDLVVWLALGIYHIPRAEDVPNTVTSGSLISFTLSPFNFFDEDPSIDSQDSVKITPKNSNHPKKGLHVHHLLRQKSTTCVPKYNNFDSLKNDGSTIFFPYFT